MNRIFFCWFIFICFSKNITAQLSNEAWDNFSKSSYEVISDQATSDVTVIFERTYIDINEVKQKGELKVEVLKTVHRKIKINSLYGLEQYNKLYIPTISDLNFNIEYIKCKAQTLKEDTSIVQTDNNNFVNTTLPANAPFFYKLDGEVKMLAIKDVNVGDQIEYVFTTRQLIEGDPYYFYKTDRVAFSDNEYYIEKSIIIDAKKYITKIWPYNFKNNITRKSNFDYNEGKKITLKNIRPKSTELYSNPYLDEPYLRYMISKSKSEKDDTWESFTKHFKPSRRSTRKQYILNGESISSTIRDIDTIGSSLEKYKTLLKKINQPLEKNFYVYDNIRDDIEVAWSYAQVLSKTLSKIKLPINFHFVCNKNYNNLDKSYVTLYQFDNIICSFNYENKTYFFPLIEPYSNLNDIRKEFQNTKCLTIAQDQFGKRSFSFEIVPEMEKGQFERTINLNLIELKENTIKLKINEKLSYTGNSWLNIKPIISHIVKDSSNTTKNLKYFVESLIKDEHEIDSLYNFSYKKITEKLNLEYSYDITKSLNPKIIDLSPNEFIEDDYQTPFHVKNQRLKNGYLNNEFRTVYTFNFNLSENFTWIENNVLKNETSNPYGYLKTDYKLNTGNLKATLSLSFKNEKFKPEDWILIKKLRDEANNFLSSKFYFKIK